MSKWFLVDSDDPPELYDCVLVHNGHNVEVAFLTAGGEWGKWNYPSPVLTWEPTHWKPVDLDGVDDNIRLAPNGDPTWKEATDDSINDLFSRVDDLDADVGSLRQNADGFRGRISAVEAQVAQYSRVTEDTDRQLRGMRHDLDVVETRYANIEQDVEANAKSWVSLQERLLRLEVQVANLEHNRSFDDESLKVLASDNVETQIRVTELEKQVADLKSYPAVPIYVPPPSQPYVPPANPWDQYRVWCKSPVVSDYGPVECWESEGGSSL